MLLSSNPHPSRMGIIFPAPAWAVKATKETDKINMGWGYVDYTTVGVAEWAGLPNTAAILLPNPLARPSGPASPPSSNPPRPSSTTPGESLASAQSAKAKGLTGASAKAAPTTAAPETAAPEKAAPTEAAPEKFSHEIKIRFPVLVNTRDLLPGDELLRRDTKPTKKRDNEPVVETALLRKARKG